MFILDIVTLLIILSIVFSVITTLTEINTSNKRKRQRQQTPPSSSSRERARPQRTPSRSFGPGSPAGRNAQRTQRRNAKGGGYSDPVFNTGKNSQRPSNRRDRSGNQNRSEVLKQLGQFDQGKIDHHADLRETDLTTAAGSKIAQRYQGQQRQALSSISSKRPQKRSSGAASLSQLKGNQLKQAVIYKEILDKPVSLRDR